MRVIPRFVTSNPSPSHIRSVMARLPVLQSSSSGNNTTGIRTLDDLVWWVTCIAMTWRNTSFVWSNSTSRKCWLELLGLFFRPSRRAVSYCPFISSVWYLGTARRRQESNCAVDWRCSGWRPHGPRTFPTVCVVSIPEWLQKSVQTGSSGTKFGRLCCDGAMAPAETLSSVSGGPYTVFWWKVLPGKLSREFQIEVATPWLPWLACLLRIVWMTSLMSTEKKTTIFSRWLVWRVLAARKVGLQRVSSVTSSSHSWCNIRDWANVEDLVAAVSSATFSTSVGTDLSIINVPYVAFGDLVDSSLSPLTVTSLGHVTEVLSPATSLLWRTQ